MEKKKLTELKFKSDLCAPALQFCEKFDIETSYLAKEFIRY